jgi:hypothetical protein
LIQLDGVQCQFEGFDTFVQQFSQGMCKPFSIISIDEIEQLKAEEADAERSKLEGMTDHRIDELVEWVEAAEAEGQARRQEEAEERRQFYHQPESEAELDDWASMPTWTLEEAIALSYGKDPQVVYWGAIKDRLDQSDFVADYADRRERVSRGFEDGQLKDPIRPGAILKWAANFRMYVPDGLRDAVAVYDKDAVNWREKFEEIQTILAELRNASPEDTRDSRQQRSDAKMIVAIAMDKFDFDPTGRRTSAASNIVSCCQRSGISISVNTVRDRLHACAKIALD